MVAIVVSGPQATGKTTLATALGTALSIPVFSRDPLMLAMQASLPWPVSRHGPWVAATGLRLQTALLARQLELGQSAILECIAPLTVRQEWRRMCLAGDVAVGVEVGEQGAGVSGAVLRVVTADGGSGAFPQPYARGELPGELGQRRTRPHLVDRRYAWLIRLARLGGKNAQYQVGILARRGSRAQPADPGAQARPDGHAQCPLSSPGDVGDEIAMRRRRARREQGIDRAVDQRAAVPSEVRLAMQADQVGEPRSGVGGEDAVGVTGTDDERGHRNGRVGVQAQLRCHDRHARGVGEQPAEQVAALPWIFGLTIFSIFGGSYVGSYSSVFGIAIHHHLPFWWDIGAVSVFSLAVYYYAIYSRLGPERVAPYVQEAIQDAHQEELALGVPEPA